MSRKDIDIINIKRPHNNEDKYSYDNLTRSRYEYLERVRTHERTREQHRKTGHKVNESAKPFLSLAALCALVGTILITKNISAIDNKTDEAHALDKTNRLPAYEQEYSGETNITVFQLEDLGHDTDGILGEIPQDFSEIRRNAEISEFDNVQHNTLTSKELSDNFQKFKEESNILYGSTEEEKVWNLLYNQLGCSAKQTAAIMGNIAEESPHYNPFQAEVDGGSGLGLFQYTGSRGTRLTEYVRNSEEYSSLYDNFIDHTKNSNRNFTIPESLDESTIDLGIICNFDYLLVYEPKYAEDSLYNRNHLDSAFTDSDSLEGMTIGFMSQVEKTPNGKNDRLYHARDIYERYVN